MKQRINQQLRLRASALALRELRLRASALALRGWIVAMLALTACLSAGFVSFSAQQRPAVQVAIGATDVGGVVTSSNGPEAGVWVVAETTDLPTKFEIGRAHV